MGQRNRRRGTKGKVQIKLIIATWHVFIALHIDQILCLIHTRRQHRAVLDRQEDKDSTLSSVMGLITTRLAGAGEGLHLKPVPVNFKLQ